MDSNSLARTNIRDISEHPDLRFYAGLNPNTIGSACLNDPVGRKYLSGIDVLHVTALGAMNLNTSAIFYTKNMITFDRTAAT